MVDIPRIGDLQEKFGLTDDQVEGLLEHTSINEDLIVDLVIMGLSDQALRPILDLSEAERLPALARVIDDALMPDAHTLGDYAPIPQEMVDRIREQIERFQVERTPGAPRPITRWKGQGEYIIPSSGPRRYTMTINVARVFWEEQRLKVTELACREAQAIAERDGALKAGEHLELIDTKDVSNSLDYFMLDPDVTRVIGFVFKIVADELPIADPREAQQRIAAAVIGDVIPINTFPRDADQHLQVPVLEENAFPVVSYMPAPKKAVPYVLKTFARTPEGWKRIS